MAIWLELDGTMHDVVTVRLRPDLVVRIDGEEHVIAVLPDRGCGRRSMIVDGCRIEFARSEDTGGFTIRLDGRSHGVGYIDPLESEALTAHAHDSVVAPMPGIVISVECAVGDAVRSGQLLVTIESMKLQQSLSAPRDGVIAAINCGAGEAFDKDAVLIALEEI